MQKVCKHCSRVLDISFFSPNKQLKDGYENICKKCRQEQRKKYTIKCEICGGSFRTAKVSTKYCSKECKGKARRNRVIKKCNYCGKEIEVIKSEDDKHIYYYCNQSCRTEHLKILMLGKSNPNYSKIEYKCDGCSKTILINPYKIQNQEHIFCSKECYKANVGKFYVGENNNNYNSVKIKCYTCGKEIYRTQSQLKKYLKHYCSIECKTISMKPLLMKNNKLRMNQLTAKCAYCGKNITITPCKLKSKNHIYCSLKCKNKGWSKFYSGENSPNWNDELTEEERIIGRKYKEYYIWRIRVYERDSYTCQCCGDSRGHNLVAHHILNYSECKNLRTDINNGISLCKDCHKEFHDIYGYTKNNAEQLTAFLISKN